MIDVVFVVLPDTLLLDLAGPAESFRLANQHLVRSGTEAAFRLRYVGPLKQVQSSVGVDLEGLEPLPATLEAPSWVVLMGRPGDAHTVASRQAWWLTTRDWLAQTLAQPLLQPQPTHRLLTVCVGALLAADAGLLHHKRITSHHELLDELAAMAPTATVVSNRVFVEDGAVITSAGVTTGIDLALHTIAQVCGQAVAQAVARVMVAYTRRSGDDTQQSALLMFRDHLHPALHSVQDAVVAAPHGDWDVESMAIHANLTPRHLARVFQAHLGTSPRRYVEHVRVALAQHAMARGASRTTACRVAGFQSPRQMLDALRRASAAPS